MVRRAHDRHTANGRPCQAFRPVRAVPIALMADVRGERVASERADRNACPPQVSLLIPEGKVKRFLRQPLVRGVTPAKVCETVQLSSGSAVYAGSHDVLSHCHRPATMRIIANPGQVCSEHALEFWTGLLVYAKDHSHSPVGHARQPGTSKVPEQPVIARCPGCRLQLQ